MEMLNVLWKMMFIFINNLIYTILLISCILLKRFYPKLRGIMGEFWAKKELKKLPKDEYIIMNNIMLKDDNGTHQIDHIVVSKYGIFVIEMKNYNGIIVGDRYKNDWLQYLGRNKYNFKNPIYQNYGHVKALECLLKLDEKNFVPIVCFSNQAKINVKNTGLVVNLNKLVFLIKKFNSIRISDNIDKIVDKIINSNITDKKEKNNHLKNIRIKIKRDKMITRSMICPKCGEKLIERDGQYGKFIGCSGYPKCRYIKPKV